MPHSLLVLSYWIYATFLPVEWKLFGIFGYLLKILRIWHCHWVMFPVFSIYHFNILRPVERSELLNDVNSLILCKKLIFTRCMLRFFVVLNECTQFFIEKWENLYWITWYELKNYYVFHWTVFYKMCFWHFNVSTVENLNCLW